MQGQGLNLLGTIGFSPNGSARTPGENQYRLGLGHEKGPDKNIEKAIGCYKLSATQGNSDALFRLAYLAIACPNEEAKEFFHLSTGFRYQNSQAMSSYFEPMANQGDTDALACRGALLRFCGPEHKQTAVECLMKSAAARNSFALLHLGLIKKEDGDLAQAHHYFERSAEQGNATAQLFLGLAYLEGEHFAADHIEAHHYFQQSAENGNPDAQFLLETAHRNGIVVEQDDKKADLYHQKRGEKEPSPWLKSWVQG